MFQEKKKGWRRCFLTSVLGIIFIAACFDYSKHVVLKKTLESEIASSQNLISFESISVSMWPVFQSHVVLKKFQVNDKGYHLTAESVLLRQGWRDWNLAHIQAKGIKAVDDVGIQEAKGSLDIVNLKTHVKVFDLILNNIQVQMPFLKFSSPSASIDFLYEVRTHQLSLKADAPEIAFANGATFGLVGHGMIETKPLVQGKMDLKIKGIDKMMKELVATNIVAASQAKLLTRGSDFLNMIGLHDVSLPLVIQAGEVFLGPVALFKIG